MRTWYQVYFEQFEKQNYGFPNGSNISADGLSIPDLDIFPLDLEKSISVAMRFLQDQAAVIDRLRGHTGPPTPDEEVIDYQIKPPFEVYVALACIHYIVEIQTPPEERESLEVPPFLKLLSRGVKAEMERLPAAGTKGKASRESIEKLSKQKLQAFSFQWFKRYSYALLWGATTGEARVFANSWDSHEAFLENHYSAAFED